MEMEEEVYSDDGLDIGLRDDSGAGSYCLCTVTQLQCDVRSLRSGIFGLVLGTFFSTSLNLATRAQ